MIEKKSARSSLYALFVYKYSTRQLTSPLLIFVQSSTSLNISFFMIFTTHPNKWQKLITIISIC